MNRQILLVGVALFLGSAVFQAVIQGSRGFETDPLDGFFGLAMLVGLILIIVGAVKSEGGARAAQEQQQQVVVYAGAPGDAAPAAPRLILRCPTCRTLNEASARFCMECGHEIPSPQAQAGRAVSAPARRPKKR